MKFIWSRIAKTFNKSRVANCRMKGVRSARTFGIRFHHFSKLYEIENCEYELKMISKKLFGTPPDATTKTTKIKIPTIKKPLERLAQLVPC